jgi:hypothetical protein
MEKNKDTENNNKPVGERKFGQTALIPLQAGCLTFAVALGAILLGLWLDTRLGTTPRWTLIMLIGSAPFALGGVFLLTRRALRKLKGEQAAAKLEEDA